MVGGEGGGGGRAARKGGAPSQGIELLLHVARELGVQSDRELAELCGVSVDHLENWKSGASQEMKAQTLAAVKEGLSSRLRTLQERARRADAAHDAGLVALEIEDASNPSALQRQFHHRVSYDYLGHRFLYFEPQGAIAWENLMKGGYDQSCWLLGVEDCARAFLEGSKDGPKGPLARALGLGRRGAAQGLDLVSLGPGEASKEALILAHVIDAEERVQQRLPWLAAALVDVSVPLLLRGAKDCRALLAQRSREGAVLPFCADFEEGELTFLRRLPTSEAQGGVRLVTMLGNVFGNVRDEEALMRERIERVVRPGDFLWLEVAVRLERLQDDPLWRMTEAKDDGPLTAAEANRRLLLEGPFRRWEAALGRRPSELSTRVWVREDDDTCRVPGSANFCHDLVLREERRACTMLYSRRYDIGRLGAWLEQRGFTVEASVPVPDSAGRARVGHVLARRK